jgi:hypothetical protein
MPETPTDATFGRTPLPSSFSAYSVTYAISSNACRIMLLHLLMAVAAAGCTVMHAHAEMSADFMACRRHAPAAIMTGIMHDMPHLPVQCC